MYNLKYGNLDASDDDVFEAARVTPQPLFFFPTFELLIRRKQSAQLHDFIMGLPNGYATVADLFRILIETDPFMFRSCVANVV